MVIKRQEVSKQASEAFQVVLLTEGMLSGDVTIHDSPKGVGEEPKVKHESTRTSSGLRHPVLPVGSSGNSDITAEMPKLRSNARVASS